MHAARGHSTLAACRAVTWKGPPPKRPNGERKSTRAESASRRRPRSFRPSTAARTDDPEPHFIGWRATSTRTSFRLGQGVGRHRAPRRRGDRNLAQRREQLVDRQRGQRLDLGRAAGRERDRDARDRGCVRRLDDVDEVELAERGPLVQDLRAELLDVTIDLAQPVGIRLQVASPAATASRGECRSPWRGTYSTRAA